MSTHASRVARYRAKADEAQHLAETMKDTVARQMMLDVASDYLQMAQTLERIDRNGKSR